MIGIVVVNYGSHELLAENLRGPEATPGACVVVVDNFSSDPELAAVRTLTAERGWHLVALPDNAGFGAGVNAGAARALELGCTCLVLLNPDATAPPETLAALCRQVVADPATMVSPRIVTTAGATYFSGSRWDPGSGAIGRVGPDGAADEQLWLTAACLVLHRDLWSRLDGFDETFFLYWEDVELSYRAVRLGARLVVRSDLEAVHDEGGTQHRSARSSRAKSAAYYYYNSRNRLVFASLHLPPRQLLRWVLVSPRESWQILLRGGRRQLVESPWVALPAVRGSWAGLVVAGRQLAGGRRRRPRADRAAR